jgi:FAD:protein FMN transferase
MIADGLATSLFFVPPERLKPHFDFTFCIVDADNRVSYSPDFNGTLFT